MIEYLRIDRAIVTIEYQQEVMGSVSNGDIFNDLDGPLIPFWRYFWFIEGIF